jgi:tetratricopeptide (TPR) repeat protein
VRWSTDLELYVQRAESELLAGSFAEAFATYQRGIVALVAPALPGVARRIDAMYAERLARDGNSLAALSGASFARWVFSDYAGAIELLDVLLTIQPDDVCGTLLRGSSRVLGGGDVTAGQRDLERAIELLPSSPDVRYVVADAYTYGARPDPKRALAEASRALQGGLDTPRVHAILAATHLAFGHHAIAGAHVARHLDLVTTELLTTEPLESGTLAVALVPGRVWVVPLPATAGATLSVATSSADVTDSIAVLLAPDGTALTGSDDDAEGSFAAVSCDAASNGTYRLRVASFEAVETGTLEVTRT